MDVIPLTRSFSTAYLVIEGTTAMLVDAAYPDLAPMVLEKLRETGATLDLIVLTHWHVDHVGAAEPLRQATGARIAIHRADAGPLRQGGEMHLRPTRLAGRLVAASFRGKPSPPLEPDLELDDSEDLAAYGGIGRSFHTPGHTAGSISVLLPDGTVLAGDAVSQGFVPYGHAEGPLFIEDEAAGRLSIEVIADTVTNDVRVAHFGAIKPASFAKLVAKTRRHGH